MTIKEVARMAGVSPAAVSRFLNGGSVSDEKSERIRDVIRQTGYHPDPMAQTMRTGRGSQIGIIVPKINSDSAAEITAGIAERLREKNFIILLGITGGSQEKEVQYLASMQNTQVAGIILMGTVMTDALRNAIDNSGKPIVVTGQDFDDVHCVYHDDFAAVKELTGRMLAKGRRRIAYLGAMEEDAAAGSSRHRGAEAAWQEVMGKDKPLVSIVAEKFDAQSGQKAMKELLERYPDLDGVICATDRIAIGAMRAIHDAGKFIPEDISIAGVGDNWADSVTNPALTSVHLYYRQCGLEAADMLLELIDTDENIAPVQKKLAYTIVERGSM